MPGFRCQITVSRVRRTACALAVALLCATAPTAHCMEPSATGQFSDERQITDADRAHWAFQPIKRPQIPVVGQGEIQNGIDAFIGAQLADAGLTFSPPATPRELFRRVHFDLLGIPPTPDDLVEFESDPDPNAYERVIDRLLASPQYGEAWGRRWLDVVRFAETAGFNADPARPLSFKYRDYVIQAFNEDRPYDRFIHEQLAGDEMFPDDPQALIATGYNAMWPDESNASDILLARQDALNDLTANVGAVFLGLSVGCAQCHDHKFDPIRQRDFYQLQAFFAGIVPQQHIECGTQEELAQRSGQMSDWQRETAAVRSELHELERLARSRAGAVKRLKFPDVVLNAIDTAGSERTPYQRQLVFWSERQIEFKEADLEQQLDEQQRSERKQLQQRLAELSKSSPRELRELDAWMGVEVSAIPPPTFLLAAGSYNRPVEQVPSNFPLVLCSSESEATVDATPTIRSSGRRAELARWMTRRDNPLVARVIVNRVWQHHFGRGLVPNANDFGTQSPPPSHPELLDWLAAELMDSDWSLKHLHRLIVTSHVYRQAGDFGTVETSMQAVTKVDPDKKLYWHFPRRRLSGEQLRDALLAVSGQLNLKMYGPGVRPPLPKNYNGREAWKVTEDQAEHSRRSVYLYAKRNLPFPMLAAFDFPDMHESCAERTETTVAPQALTMLNSDEMLKFAGDFARRLTDEQAELGLVERAYLYAFGRRPNPDEQAAAAEFLQRQEKYLGEAGVERTSIEAVKDFCHSLLNANEFLYVD